MAARRKLADFANMYLKYHMAQKQAEYQSELQRQRQLEVARYNREAIQKQADLAAEQDLLEKGLADPTGRLLARFQNAGRTQLNRMPIEQLLPSRENQLAREAAGVEGADTLAKLPTMEGQEIAMGGLPNINTRDPRDLEPITNLIAKRREQLKASAPPVAEKFIDTSSGTPVPSQRYVNPWEQMGQPPAQVELTGAQKGSEGLNEFMANQGSQLRGDTEFKQWLRKENAMTGQMRNRAEQAAEIAARVGSQIAGGVDESGQPGFFKLDKGSGRATRIEGASPTPTGGAGGAGGAGNRQESMRTFVDAYEKLSKDINSSSGFEQMQNGTYRWGAQLFNQDDTALLFNTMKKPLGVMLAVIAQGSRPTDVDAKAFESLLPGFTTPKPVAEQMMANIKKVIGESGYGDMSLQQILASVPERTITPAERQFYLQQLQKRLTTPSGAMLPNEEDLIRRAREEGIIK